MVDDAKRSYPNVVQTSLFGEAEKPPIESTESTEPDAGDDGLPPWD